MSVHGITAENAENLEEIEKQWAVKAMHHAETYFSLLTKVDGAKLRLTKIDDEIYEDFVNHFPHLNVASLDEMNDFKTENAKAKWREFIMKWALCLCGFGPIFLTQSHPRYENKVQDYNFGTLLRIRSNAEYAEDNCFFGEISCT